MADVLVVGDTAPIITGKIHDQTDSTDFEDLNGCTVMFQMRRANDRRLMINREADVINPASGEVSYTLFPNDTSVPGDYVIQWQVIYPDGKKQTTATLHEVTIRRR